MIDNSILLWILSGVFLLFLVLIYLEVMHVRHGFDDQLRKVGMDDVETYIKEKVGAINNQLNILREINGDIKQLNSFLTNPKIRGYWGERAVENIISYAGLHEGTDYVKQKSGEHNRPDFTFFLPNGKKINLDAKFPIDNYKKFVEAESEIEKERYKKEFISDVKRMIKDVSQREYMNESTVDLILLFIANEGAYSFLLNEDGSIVDEALKKKIVLCSPVTLYAVLSIVRQASSYYMIQKNTKDILDLMSEFSKEWGKFVDVMDKSDKALDNLNKKFEELRTTRKKKLESVLKRIDEKKKLENSESSASLTDNLGI